MEKTRLEVWRSDLKVAAEIRKIKGLQSARLFHEALLAYCEKNDLDYHSLAGAGGNGSPETREKNAETPETV